MLLNLGGIGVWPHRYFHVVEDFLWKTAGVQYLAGLSLENHSAVQVYALVFLGLSAQAEREPASWLLRVQVAAQVVVESVSR